MKKFKYAYLTTVLSTAFISNSIGAELGAELGAEFSQRVRSNLQNKGGDNYKSLNEFKELSPAEKYVRLAIEHILESLRIQEMKNQGVEVNAQTALNAGQEMFAGLIGHSIPKLEENPFEVEAKKPEEPTKPVEVPVEHKKEEPKPEDEPTKPVEVTKPEEPKPEEPKPVEVPVEPIKEEPKPVEVLKPKYEIGCIEQGVGTNFKGLLLPEYRDIADPKLPEKSPLTELVVNELDDKLTENEFDQFSKNTSCIDSFLNIFSWDKINNKQKPTLIKLITSNSLSAEQLSYVINKTKDKDIITSIDRTAEENNCVLISPDLFEKMIQLKIFDNIRYQIYWLKEYDEKNTESVRTYNAMFEVFLKNIECFYKEDNTRYNSYANNTLGSFQKNKFIMNSLQFDEILKNKNFVFNHLIYLKKIAPTDCSKEDYTSKEESFVSKIIEAYTWDKYSETESYNFASMLSKCPVGCQKLFIKHSTPKIVIRNVLQIKSCDIESFDLEIDAIETCGRLLFSIMPKDNTDDFYKKYWSYSCPNYTKCLLGMLSEKGLLNIISSGPLSINALQQGGINVQGKECLKDFFNYFFKNFIERAKSIKDEATQNQIFEKLKNLSFYTGPNKMEQIKELQDLEKKLGLEQSKNRSKSTAK